MLCVIDMQTQFVETAQCCIGGVIDEIDMAVRQNIPIVVVSYLTCGDLLPQINNTILKHEDYSTIIFLTKNSNSASVQLIDTISKFAQFPSNVKIVGVNRNFCILDTVMGLVESTVPCKIEVSEKATWCVEPNLGLLNLQDCCSIV